MHRRKPLLAVLSVALVLATAVAAAAAPPAGAGKPEVGQAAAHDVSRPLSEMGAPAQ